MPTGAALAGDRRDADGPRAVAQREFAGGVKDAVGVVFAWRRHHLVRSFYMERPPYIDELAADVAASREQTWSALRSVLRSDLSGGAAAPLVRFLRVCLCAGCR